LKFLRIMTPLALSAVCSVAYGQANFSSISAFYSMTPASGTINWIVNTNSPAYTIDFTQNAPPFKIGDTTGFSTGSSTISFNVTAPTLAIKAVDLVLQGDVEAFGRIQFSESVSDGSGSLGTITGSILGASWGGNGVNGAFTKVYHLDFSRSVNSFTVNKSFFMDINEQQLPSSSIALVSIVEQNFTPVPEPASIACLAAGAIALIRRRKK